jgi:hypothetical protein
MHTDNIVFNHGWLIFFLTRDYSQGNWARKQYKKFPLWKEKSQAIYIQRLQDLVYGKT